MKITAKMMFEKEPCAGYTLEKLQELAGEGLSLLQILSLNIPDEDRVWAVTRFLPDIENRKFAIWCARQCNNIPEITASIDTIERYYILNTGTKDEMIAAYSAAYSSADRAAYSSAYSAARKKQIEYLHSVCSQLEEEEE